MCMVCVTAGAAAIGLVLGGVSTPNPSEIQAPSALSGTTQSDIVSASQGPQSGEFRAWTKGQTNGTQVKFYAKYPQPGQKIQFMAQNGNGAWREIGWKRIGPTDLDVAGNYRGLTNEIYFVRTFNLTQGSFNRLRIDVDGKTVWGSVRATWRPGGAPSPTPIGGAELAYAEPSQPGGSVEMCRIREISNSRGMTWAGFPDQGPMTQRSGVVRWALIPIDFPDLPGESGFRTRVDDQMELLSEWFETVSGGKLKVEWVVLDRWATLPENSTEYVIPESVNVSDAANGPKLFVDAMNAADPLFDFSGVQTVNFILPGGQTFIGEGSQGFPWDEVVRNYRSNEGSIDSYSIPGQYFDLPGKAYWSYWAHEFGHAIGLPHVGSSRGDLPPFNPWDIMGGQDGPSRELSGWLRFLANWLDDDQIFCKRAADIRATEITLIPLSGDQKGVKVAMLPLSETKLLIIESRRETKFSCTTTPSRNGVLVYVYDATLGHGQNFLREISPAGRPNQRDSCNSLNFRGTPPNPDFLLRKGDRVVYEGLTVEVLEHANLDRVRVTRG